MVQKKKLPKDPNQKAKSVVDMATGQQPVKTSNDEARAAAAALGRLGGKKGGPARAKKLSSKRRKEIAQLAAAARWGKVKGK